MDMNQVRRMNLRRLVSEHEGMNKLAQKLGLTRGAYISQLLMDPPVRDLSEKTVRKWERKLNLPTGWFDGAKAPQATPAVDGGLLTQCLTEVTASLKAAKIDLAPAQLAELVTMQYTDAAATGRVDTTRLNTIIGLIKR